MNNDLAKDILSTILYYDILGYPMTAFEVWKYLGVYKKNDRQAVCLSDVMEELEGMELRRHIGTYRGFYFMVGRKCLVSERIEKDKLSGRKMKIIRKVASVLRFVPYVRFVAVTGTVAQKNADRESDLDLLIAIKGGRLFLGRTLVTALVHIMGKRRYANKISDRICLNCFLTEESLESRLQDAFSSSEYFFMRSLFGQDAFFKFQRDNQWISRFKTNFYIAEDMDIKALSEKGPIFAFKKIMEDILNIEMFGFLEKRLEKWQMERIARDPRTLEDGSIIMADPEALIFFHRAHGIRMEELFQGRLKKMHQETV